MRNVLICTACALLYPSHYVAAQNPPVTSQATISAVKGILPDLPNQPAGTKGVSISGSYDCGYGKVAPVGQPDTCDRIVITVYSVTKQGKAILLTTADEDELQPRPSLRNSSYTSKRFNLPVTDPNTQLPVKYRVDVLLYINGQLTSAATTFIPEFTL